MRLKRICFKCNQTVVVRVPVALIPRHCACARVESVVELFWGVGGLSYGFEIDNVLDPFAGLGSGNVESSKKEVKQ